MPGTTDPPRPTLTSTIRNYLKNDCVWNAQTSRVELAQGGTPVYAWLGQTGNPGLSATVEWAAGADPGVGGCVKAVIGQTELDTIKNGTYDSQSGIVTYGGKNYSFRYEAGANGGVMKRHSL